MQNDSYFAGLFDGEGSVGIYAIGNGLKTKSGGTTYWSVKLSIVGTYRPAMEAAWQHFGVGGFGTQKRQTLGHLPNKGPVDVRLGKQGWRWSAYAKHEVAAVLRRMLPYLMEKRDQAEIVLAFCEGRLDGETASRQCKKAKRFGFHAKLGEHLPGQRGMKSEGNPMAKLTYAQAQEIRRRHKAGVKQVALARKYGASKSQISRIVKRQTYNHKPVF